MSNQAFVFHPKPNVVSTELDDEEAVLLDLTTRRYYTLNDTGARIWELLNAGKTTAEIAAALTEEWTVEQPDALAYVQAFLNELADEGLIDRRPA